jgi:hypothetical protein
MILEQAERRLKGIVAECLKKLALSWDFQGFPLKMYETG